MRPLFASLIVAITLATAAIFAVPLIAQESEEEQKSGFLRFVENKLSAPGRVIEISALDGALSSNVTIPEITVSDTQGVWLRIENAKLNWKRSALLTGKLRINSLSADRIDYLRAAIPAKSRKPQALEAVKFEVPEFPVAILIKELSLDRVTFAQDVFGLGSQVSVTGKLDLKNGSLDTVLKIIRQDGPGGALDVDIKYGNWRQKLDLDIALVEPEDGVVANLLGIEGRPDLDLRIKGSGRLKNLETSLTLDAGGKRALTGEAKFSEVKTGLAITADMHGPIADLVPAIYKSFFGDDTKLIANGLVREGGGFTLNNLTLDGGELALVASAETTDDGFLSQFGFDANVASNNGQKVTLPGGDGKTRVGSARLKIDYGTDENWVGSLSAANVDFDSISARDIQIDLTGVAANINVPAAREVTFNIDGDIVGITANDPKIVDVLGQKIDLSIAGRWHAREALKISRAQINGKSLNAELTGEIDDFVFDGRIALQTPSIAPFSGFAKRQLDGKLDMTATGTIALLSGGFDLAFEGETENLVAGARVLDKLLAGPTSLFGRLARDESGLHADKFQIANSRGKISADGQFSSNAADFEFSAAINNVGLLSDKVSGALNVIGTARGKDGLIALDLTGKIPTGFVAEKRLANANLGFKGTLRGERVKGKINGTAFLDGHRVILQADIARAAQEIQLKNLKLDAVGTKVAGDISQTTDGLLTGALDIRASDVSTAAALLLTKASGAMTASVKLAPLDGQQSMHVSANLQTMKIDTMTIGRADVEADIRDLFGVPVVEGMLSGANIAVGGVDVATLSADASLTGKTTAFRLESRLRNDADISVSGSLTPIDKGFAISLDAAQLTQGQLSARLNRPANLTVLDKILKLNNIVFNVGGGQVIASGTAGETLNLAVDISDLPLSIANIIRPDLGLDGVVNASLAVSGTPSDPSVRFNLRGRGIGARAIGSFNIAPVRLTASGIFAKDTIRLTTLDASGSGGVSLSASGAMPLIGSNGNMTIRGQVPLALANRSLSLRGARVSGIAAIDARVTGSVARPRFNGTVSVDGAEIVDPLTNLRLQAIQANASLTGDRLVIDRFSGNLATGGSIDVSGSVSLLANRDFPADISIRLNAARYTDGNLFVATASGDLNFAGPLLRNPVLSGNLQLEKAEISIPDSLGKDNALVEVNHIAASAPVIATLARLNLDGSVGKGAVGRSVVQLDVAVSVPNQMFIRGRGVDAELGGSVRLTGSVSNVQPVGGFELIRGRLSILGQRITFKQGLVTLVGNLDPYIHLSAQSEADDTTVFVTLDGPASDLAIIFSSDPELPEDEVLSRLIFKRGLGDLSPLQLAKLAAAAGELSGGGSLVDDLRQATGLDDIDVVTDADGNAAVKAGAYLQDNVYLSVQAGAQGQSRISIDLDISDTVKARGSTGNDGETSLGIFFEQDY